MKNNFAIFNDEEDLIMIQDDFKSKEEAEKYSKEHDLIGEYYFIGQCDDLDK